MRIPSCCAWVGWGRRSAALVLCLGCACVGKVSGASGQSATASLGGIVRESSDAVLPGALITLTSLDSGRRRPSIESNADGYFQFVALPPGAYRVAITLEGFVAAERDVELVVDQSL